MTHDRQNFVFKKNLYPGNSQRAIAFILNAVICNEVSFAAIINQGFSQFPYGMRRMFFTPQIIINRIMTDIVQMISQISTSIVDRSTDHILDIALFSDFHSVIISDNWVYTTPSESPDGMRRMFFTPQIIINRIMTDIVQMISQISTSIVDRSTDHILDIALFSDFHSVIISDNWVYTTPSESPDQAADAEAARRQRAEDAPAIHQAADAEAAKHT